MIGTVLALGMVPYSAMAGDRDKGGYSLSVVMEKPMSQQTVDTVEHGESISWKCRKGFCRGLRKVSKYPFKPVNTCRQLSGRFGEKIKRFQWNGDALKPKELKSCNKV